MFQAFIKAHSVPSRIFFSTVTFLFLFSANATCHAQTPVIFELDIDVFGTTWTGNSPGDWFADSDSDDRNWLGLPRKEEDEDVFRDRLARSASIPGIAITPEDYFLPANAFNDDDAVVENDGHFFRSIRNFTVEDQDLEFRGPHSTFLLNTSEEDEFVESYTFRTPRVFISQRGDTVDLTDLDDDEFETSLASLTLASPGDPLIPPARLNIERSRLNIVDIRADRFGSVSNEGIISIEEGSIAVDGEFENRSRLTVNNGAILVGGDLDQTFGGSTSIDGGNLIVVGSILNGEVNFEGGNITIGSNVSRFENLRFPRRSFPETVSPPANPFELITFQSARLSLSSFDTFSTVELDSSNEAVGADFQSINSSTITLGPNCQINGDFTNTGNIIVTGENSFVPIAGTVINRGNISVEREATLIVLDLDNESTVSATDGDIDIVSSISNQTGEIRSMSGDIFLNGVVENQMGEIRSETGDIFLRGPVSNEFGVIRSENGVVEVTGGPITGGAIGCNSSDEIIIFGGRLENVTFDGSVQVLGGASLDGVTFFGRISGAGFLEGNFINHGVIAPGFSPGTLNFAGDVTLAETSILEMEVFGSQPGQFDVLNVLGNLELGGSVEIDFGDFVPQADDEIEFLVVDNMTGEFDNVTIGGSGVSNDGGVSFDVVQSGGNLMLTNFAPILLGDINRDDVVDFSDIPSFIAVLVSGSFQLEADIDLDGVVNFLDIAPFIQLLTGQ